MASQTRRNDSFLGFLDILKSVLAQTQSLFEEGPLTDNRLASVDALENLSVKMDEICETLVIFLNSFINPADDTLWQQLYNLLCVFFEIKKYLEEETNKLYEDEENAQMRTTTSNVLVTTTGTRNNPGRPRYEIDEDQVLFLRSKHFKWRKIAQILNISDRTLRRKRQEFSARTENFSDISEADLCEVIESIRSLTPNIGQSRLLGALRCKGFKIQRWRVRNCLRKLDPVGTALRGHVAIYRRKYYVPYPNFLWHLDGNHKLINWRMVVHACIDGYSRMIIYLSCENNNLASTVYNLFIEGVSKYGLPKKIRTDHGLENVQAARYMLQQRGTDCGSVLTGRSVHNVRVERLHRDVYSGVLSHYASLFTFMEGEGLLNIDSEEHLLALQEVFFPRINRSLNEFVNQWNSHPVSSAGHQSPEQMFITALLNSATCDDSLPAESLETLGAGLADDDAPDPDFIVQEKDYAVFVPPTELEIPRNISSEQFLTDDGNYGIYHYIACLEAIQGNNE
ncbi:uncharacterized protein LOC114542313 [Dendronephthya gigantea]|uniref:uncharacterized protein LOC114542313 n=1 Tax=Dendronephthya gigantea TaxID=151771 RepID=UPI00106D3195|nr:uncharacterized protein LOC114542313 [Dendronephthya gigantea]